MRLPDEPVLDLMVARITDGLDDAEASRLRVALDADAEAATFMEEVELAAAATATGLLPGAGSPQMPAGLRAAILEGARDFQSPRDAPTADAPGHEAARSPWSYLPVLVVALLAAVLGAQLLVSGVPSAVRAPAPAELRQELLVEAKDVLQLSWASVHDSVPAVEGDVVWSDQRQQGTMRLRGLPANDPRVAQYQLWIVDPDRDQHPIDGGVFDVSSSGEAVIPIVAKLPVDEPQAFVLTLEQPGGVVVSNGPHLVIAAVQ